MRPTKFPAIDDITMVIPTKITDLGVYVNLIEYDNIEGLIILSDLSRSRFRSINRVVTIGKKFAACVQTVNDKNKNITLSKKHVSETDAKICDNNYRMLKTIQDFVNLYSNKIQRENNISIPIDTIYQTFIWNISDNPETIIASLKLASKDFNSIYENKLQNIDSVWIDCFHKALAIKFKEKNILLEAIMEITCIETSGINIIKNTLINAYAMSSNDFPFKIKLVKSPYYSITIKTDNKEEAINIINNVINFIKSDLEKNSATIKIIKIPEIVVDKEFEPEKSDSDDSESEIDEDN